jgi:hypothetical protein
LLSGEIPSDCNVIPACASFSGFGLAAQSKDLLDATFFQALTAEHRL